MLLMWIVKLRNFYCKIVFYLFFEMRGGIMVYMLRGKVVFDWSNIVVLYKNWFVIYFLVEKYFFYKSWWFVLILVLILNYFWYVIICYFMFLNK